MEKIKTLTLLHLVNILSLLFVVGNLVLRLFYDGNHYGGLFLWSLLMSVLLLYLKEKTRYYGGALILWVVIPWIIGTPPYQIAYVGLIGLLMVLLFYKDTEEPLYERIEFEFSIGITTAAVFLFFALIMGGLQLFSNVAAGYLLLYILSGVLILRSLRFLEHNGDIAQLKKINRRAIGIIGVLSIILSSNFFMNWFLELRGLLWKGYNLVIDFVLWVLYWPIYWIGTLMNYLLITFINWIRQRGSLPQEGSENVVGDMEEIHETIRSTGAADSPLFRIILGVGLLVLLIFVLYKLYTRKAMTRKISETYTERKEVILPTKEGSYWENLKKRLKPKTKEERVRQYYRGFLEGLAEKGVVLLPSDTTGDFHRKGEAFFSAEELRVFRNIYLQVRYGEKEIDRKTYKEAKRIYEELTKKESGS